MDADGYIIDPEALPADQRHQALTYADTRRWLRFLHVTPGRPSERRYVVEIGLVQRRLRPDDVIPYVRGQADARGEHDLFPPDPGP